MSDDQLDLSWRSFGLALHALSQRSTDRAVELSVEAAQIMRDSTGLGDDLVHIWPVAAELAIRTENERAIGALLGMIDEASIRMQVPLGIEAHRQRVDGLLVKSEKPEQATALLRAAIEMFTIWGARPYQARTEIELGQILVDQGDTEGGQALVDRGRAVLEELGAAGWLRELGLDPTGVTA